MPTPCTTTYIQIPVSRSSSTGLAFNTRRASGGAYASPGDNANCESFFRTLKREEIRATEYGNVVFKTRLYSVRFPDCRQLLPYRIMEGYPVSRVQRPRCKVDHIAGYPTVVQILSIKSLRFGFTSQKP